MRKLILLVAIAALLVPTTLAQQANKRYNMYGVMFYNLENLFDTINNNGRYDEEFSPNGARQWNGTKYWQKIHNMAYAIGQMATKNTPYGPAIIGVSEIENITVLQDIVKQPEVKDWHLQIAPYHESPDRRGVDVGLLYNPRYFRVLNVTNQTLVIDGEPNFKTRDQMCVTGLLAGEKVSILINHWPSRLGGEDASSYKREAAGRAARRVVDSLLRDDPNQGIIIMGDLNDDPMNKSCREAMGARKYIKDVKNYNDLFNPWWHILEDKGIGTLGYRGSWNLFDQIIINGYFLKHQSTKDKPQLTYLRAEVLNRDFLITKEGTRKGYPHRTFSAGVFLNGYSDHFPTEIFLVKEAE